MMMRNKVFGIGLNKTGTTTLSSCLEILGYRHKSYSIELLRMLRSGKLDEIRTECAKYDSFEDWPYPLMYKELDQWFPGSKFILTTRITAERWLQSLESHSLRVDPEIGCETRSIAYGFPYPQLNRKAHLDFYKAHCDAVRSYFANSPERFLEVCWESEGDWKKLCEFLDCNVPLDIPFPHSNQSCKPKEDTYCDNIGRLKALGG